MDPAPTPAPDSTNPQPQAAPAASVPQAPAPQPASGASAHIDLGKILLPTKEVHSNDSAQRINAGALLEQEVAAATQGIPAEQKAAETAPPPPMPKVPQNPSSVKPLETFQSDIAELVEKKNVSAVTIAAAEAKRSGSTAAAPEEGGGWGTKLLLFFVGALLIAGASGLVAYVFLLPTTVPVAQAPQTPFIAVDGTVPVTLDPGSPRAALMGALTQAMGRTQIPLGLVGRLYPLIAGTTTGAMTQEMDAQTFLGTLAPSLQPEFLRAIEPTFLLGIYSYAQAQPFLILRVDSYEQAYSGMLAWEGSMAQDLSPLFFNPASLAPAPQTPSVQASSSATTSVAAASTTPQAPQPQAPLLPVFTDRVVENHDARVIQDASGNIVLLWTFLDRNTLVIATTDAALKEVISRLKDAAVVPLVGK